MPYAFDVIFCNNYGTLRKNRLRGLGHSTGCTVPNPEQLGDQVYSNEDISTARALSDPEFEVVRDAKRGL